MNEEDIANVNEATKAAVAARIAEFLAVKGTARTSAASAEPASAPGVPTPGVISGGAPAPGAEVWGRQFDAGLAWVDFPVGWGGMGAPRSLRAMVAGRLREAGVPDSGRRNGIGVTLAAPVLMAFGTSAQRDRFLRPLFSGEEIWCQLFSEPGAGSDLASLSTRAVRDSDGWLVSGHKVWTTLAHVSRWGLLCARTDPDAPKHAGLTCFVVDMRAPGVRVEPIRQITGDAEFNEVILTDVRLPAGAVIGEVGAGWQVILSVLAHERESFADEPLERGGGAIAEASRLWAERGGDHPELRDSYVQLWIRSEAVRLASLEAAAASRDGQPSPAWSALKVLRCELDQEIYDLCVTLLGIDGLLYPSYEMRQPSRMDEMAGYGGDIRRQYLFSLCHTIAGGTSEIQRTIIADRVLRLPREPQPDRDMSWRRSRRG